MVFPGLEEVAGEEIVRSLKGEIKRTGPGIVVFRVADVDARVLRLRTVEDVFLLGWGTDQLTYRAEDLETIRRWTTRDADWEQLLRIHHAIRPKPKGKPTYRLVTQMDDDHGYRRVDAQKAMAQGLAGKLPASWRPAEENAAVEIWLTIHERQAVCGLRLSDRTMRHRTYKKEHLRASLRPSVASAMLQLADSRPGLVLVDPMCGAGTILAEHLDATRSARTGPSLTWGGDCELAALRAAALNTRFGGVQLACWDARRLPLADLSVDRIVSNPPFGKQLSSPAEIGPLYQAMVLEYDRILRPGGKAVLLVADVGRLVEAVRGVGWKKLREVRLRVLGQPAAIMAWQKKA